MPLRKLSTQDNRRPRLAPPPSNDAEVLAPIDLDPAITRGLRQWAWGTLPDGRVVLELELVGLEGLQERRVIVLSRPGADQLGDDLKILAEALHPVG